MKRKFGLMMISLLLGVIPLAACNITESGNPWPVPQPDTSPLYGTESDEAAYVDTTYGVRILNPTGWSYQVPNTNLGSIVRFYDNRDPQTNVFVYITEFPDVYVSLGAYLNAHFPDTSMLPYDTGTLDGFYYDEDSLGPYGGDLQYYFFAEQDILIEVEAEIFPAGAPEFEEFLTGISFPE